MTGTIKAKRYKKDSNTPELVTITVAKSGLSVISGQTKLSIAYSQLELQPAGHMDKLTILHEQQDGTTLICEDKQLLAELAKTASSSLQKAALERIATDRSSTRRVLAGWTAIACGAMIVIAIVCSSADLVAGWVCQKVPPDIDVQAGDAYFNQYRNEHDLLPPTAPDVRRIRTIGNRLIKQLGAAGAPYHFNFVVENSDEINAFAFPGGNIVVYSKLIESADSDDELAGVLGHEMGHVIHRHTLRHLVYSGGTAVTLDLLFHGGGSYATLLKKYLELDRLRYSRNEESDADKTGVDLSMDADYNPNGIISFHKRIAKTDALLNNSLTAFESDHPMPSERIKQIEQDIRDYKSAPMKHQVSKTETQ